MAAVIKVEPDSDHTDSDSEPLSPQVTTELTDPIEEKRSAQFTFVPVNTQIKVENNTLLLVEQEEEEITMHVTPIKQEEEEEEEQEMCVNEDGVMQFITEHDPFTGETAITHRDHQSSSFTSAFGDDFHLPSNHSLLRTRLQKDRTLFCNRPDQITCNICGKRFRFPCDFKRHSVMHTGERLFKCEECQKRFKLLSHLKMHIYRFHTRERPYSCDSCGKRYASMTDLRCHLLIHSPERPHLCSVCSKGFFSAKDLRKHVQIHTGERQFECDVCKRKFLRRGHLENHIAVVHVHKRRHDCRTRSRKLKFLDQKVKKK